VLQVVDMLARAIFPDSDGLHTAEKPLVARSSEPRDQTPVPWGPRGRSTAAIDRR
jgi:hypothetical protein